LESSRAQHREKSRGFPVNQDRFIWNSYIEFMKDQRDVNAQLITAVDQLGEIGRKIVRIVSNQQHVHRHRYNYLHDRVWEVLEKLKSASAKQDTIREELGKQGEAVFRLRKSFQDHRMSMREFRNHVHDDLHDVLDMLDRLSANDAKIGELQEEVIDKLEEHDMQRRQEAEEVEKTIERILLAKKSIGKLLSALPPIIPIQRIVVDGIAIDVNHLLNVDEKKGIAYFSSPTGVVTVDIDKLDAIHW
jgi:DNA repair ATPase RecN